MRNLPLPKRPPGWTAPGPTPRPPHDRSNAWPSSTEDLSFLAGDWRLLQKKRGHRWSLDDLVTASVAAESCPETSPRTILDLGCGIGAVLLLLAWRYPEARLIGIEAQAASASLARRSIDWNGVGDRCRVVNGDLRRFGRWASSAEFDLVTGTPPYLPPGTATPPRRENQDGSHLERRGGIEAYCRAARNLVARSGRFVACHSDQERTETAATEAGFSITRRVDVVPRSGRRNLFSVFVLRPGFATEPLRSSRLVVRDGRGQWTASFLRIRSQFGMPPAR